MLTDFENVTSLVEDERARQDAQWGGATHDDTCNDEHWAVAIMKQLEFFKWEQSQDRLVKIAALAFAAIEQRLRGNV